MGKGCFPITGPFCQWKLLRPQLGVSSALGSQYLYSGGKSLWSFLLQVMVRMEFVPLDEGRTNCSISPAYLAKRFYVPAFLPDAQRSTEVP